MKLTMTCEELRAWLEEHVGPSLERYNPELEPAPSDYPLFQAQHVADEAELAGILQRMGVTEEHILTPGGKFLPGPFGTWKGTIRVTVPVAYNTVLHYNHGNRDFSTRGGRTLAAEIGGIRFYYTHQAMGMTYNPVENRWELVDGQTRSVAVLLQFLGAVAQEGSEFMHWIPVDLTIGVPFGSKCAIDRHRLRTDVLRGETGALISGPAQLGLEATIRGLSSSIEPVTGTMCHALGAAHPATVSFLHDVCKAATPDTSHMLKHGLLGVLGRAHLADVGRARLRQFATALFGDQDPGGFAAHVQRVSNFLGGDRSRGMRCGSLYRHLQRVVFAAANGEAAPGKVTEEATDLFDVNGLVAEAIQLATTE